jgi:hypothetical protein
MLKRRKRVLEILKLVGLGKNDWIGIDEIRPHVDGPFGILGLVIHIRSISLIRRSSSTLIEWHGEQELGLKNEFLTRRGEGVLLFAIFNIGVNY